MTLCPLPSKTGKDVLLMSARVWTGTLSAQTPNAIMASQVSLCRNRAKAGTI